MEEEEKKLAEAILIISKELEAKRLQEENARLAEEQRLAEEAAKAEADIKVIPDLPPKDD